MREMGRESTDAEKRRRERDREREREREKRRKRAGKRNVRTDDHNRRYDFKMSRDDLNEIFVICDL